MNKIEKTKGPSDFLATYIHNPLENRIVLILKDGPVTPNQITIIVNLVAYFTAILFFFGYLLPASLLTFLVGLLDGVDGKLARAKNMSSKVGSMEHSFDLLYEFSWLFALALFLSRETNSSWPLILCTSSIILIAFYRNCYSRFSKETSISLDIYGKFDRYFRRIAGRRNLYNLHILIWALLNLPFYALLTITFHAAITAAIYSFRACYILYKIDKNPNFLRHQQ